MSSSKRLVGELFSKETCLLREEGCFHSERLVCSDPEEVATSGLIFQLLSRGCPPGMPSGSVNHRRGEVCVNATWECWGPVPPKLDSVEEVGDGICCLTEYLVRSRNSASFFTHTL